MAEGLATLMSGSLEALLALWAEDPGPSGPSGAGIDAGAGAKEEQDESQAEGLGDISGAGSDEDDADGGRAEALDAEDAPTKQSDASSPRKRRANHGAKSCCVCLMGENDIDLSDSGESRTTPFANSQRSGQYVICDHCDSLLRYAVGNRSAA